MIIIKEENNDKSIRKQYNNEDAAYKYCRYLKNKGIDACVYPFYDERTQSSIYTVDKCKQDIEEDYDDYEDYDELDSGDIVYEAKAYYNSRYSGLAYSETFANGERSELNDWIWEMCQRGFYVTVYDYEYGDYSYYRWPDNAEYLELYSSEDLETDEHGNFLNIDETVGLK